MNIKKKYITDDKMNPVAVIIDYKDWQDIKYLMKNNNEFPTMDLKKYNNTIEIPLDPLQFQNDIRSEWG